MSGVDVFFVHRCVHNSDRMAAVPAFQHLEEEDEEAAVEAAPSSPVRLSIDGMMCMKNCGTTVQTALRAVAGVQR